MYCMHQNSCRAIGRRLPALIAGMALALLSPSGFSAPAPAYIGYEGCVMCHRAQYADWERSAHARAFDLLKPGRRNAAKRKADLDPAKDYTNTEECLQCHTTGYRKEGGFVSILQTPNRAGVGCEMCHGPGGEYREIHKAERSALDRARVIAAGQVYASEDPKICTNCHEHEDMPFQPELDDKYRFDPEPRLKQTRSFHRHYR
jgi:hypothetical protein